MQRHDMIDTMRGLGLKGMAAAFDEAVAEVGIGKARVWKLYLAASQMGFHRNMIQLHQVLAVLPDEHGDADVPLRLGFDTR